MPLTRDGRAVALEDVELGEPIFQKLHPEATVPSRKYADDIGWDLTVRSEHPMVIAPGEFADLPCDLAVELPRGTWGMIVGRSSALRRHGLLVNIGIIDQSYRGELFAGAFNVSRKAVVVNNGWRLAQLIVVARRDPEILHAVCATDLSATARAANRFGSTGY